MRSRIFKNISHRGYRTPIYRKRLKAHATVPNSHKAALMVVRIFSRTKIHTKRFLSRSVSSHEASLLTKCFPHETTLHMKRLSSQGVFPNEDVSSHEAFLHNAEFHHSAMSPVAHSDELLYPAQATTPQELDQFRPRRHPATVP